MGPLTVAKPGWWLLVTNKSVILIMKRPLLQLQKMKIVQTVLAIAASQSWSLFLIDVKNAFLHSDLKEEVCMKLPPGTTRT